jgi:hypothetical protein
MNHMSDSEAVDTFHQTVARIMHRLLEERQDEQFSQPELPGNLPRSQGKGFGAQPLWIVDTGCKMLSLFAGGLSNTKSPVRTARALHQPTERERRATSTEQQCPSDSQLPHSAQGFLTSGSHGLAIHSMP